MLAPSKIMQSRKQSNKQTKTKTKQKKKKKRKKIAGRAIKSCASFVEI